MKFNYLLLSLAYLYFVDAEVRFISNFDDYQLNCSLQTNAGNVLATVLNRTSFVYQVARLDVTKENADVYLLDNSIFENMYSSTTVVDPVEKYISLLVKINNTETIVVYDAINGSLMKQLPMPKIIFMQAIDVVDLKVYGMMTNNSKHLFMEVNMLTGELIEILEIPAAGVLSPTQTVDLTKRVYSFFGKLPNDTESIYLFMIDLVTRNVTYKYSSNGTVLYYPVGYNNDQLLVFINNRTNVRLGVINTQDMIVTELNETDIYYEFGGLPRGYDIANNRIYGPLGNQSVIHTFDSITGKMLFTSYLPPELIVQAVIFEPNCICCVSEEQQTLQFALQKKYELQRFNKCDVSSASMMIPEYIFTIMLLALLIIRV